MEDSRNDLRNRREPARELRSQPSNAELRRRGEEMQPGDQDTLTKVQFPELTKDELERIPLMQPGTHLEQGSVYVDLDRLENGPFRALGSTEVKSGDRYVAKRDADYETWNRLVGDREPPEI